MVALDTKEAGKFLRRSEAAIRNLVIRGKIPHRRVGGRLLFIREELSEWVMMCPGVKITDLRE